MRPLMDPILSSILFGVVFYFSLHIIQAQENWMTGAVVNYEPKWDVNKSPDKNIILNAESYCDFIQQASKSGADIIVFPADGLHGTKKPIIRSITNVQNQSNDEVMSLLSRCTRNSNIYVILVVDESVNRQRCVTQVVLARDGTIIARNREMRCRNCTESQDEMFNTDKGYKIGLMLNEDIYLNERTERLIKHEVHHFALSYDLLESLPFSTAIQTEWWWSYGQNSILMAAGLSEPGRSGSGIYMGRMHGFPRITNGYRPAHSKLLIHSLPNSTSNFVQRSYFWDEPKMGILDRIKKTLSRIPRRTTATAYAESYVSVEKRDLNEEKLENLSNYTKIVLNVEYIKIVHDNELAIMDETLCNGELCCRFKLVWNVKMKNRKTNKHHNEETKKNQINEPVQEGCYLLVVGNQNEVFEDQGEALVKRCSLVYSTSGEYCSSHHSIEQHFFSIIHRLQLNRNNAILKHLEIIANQRNLTPNILLENRYQTIPANNQFIYKDLPMSRLYLWRTFHKFITFGLQRVDNYTLI